MADIAKEVQQLEGILNNFFTVRKKIKVRDEHGKKIFTGKYMPVVDKSSWDKVKGTSEGKEGFVKALSDLLTLAEKMDVDTSGISKENLTVPFFDKYMKPPKNEFSPDYAKDVSLEVNKIVAGVDQKIEEKYGENYYDAVDAYSVPVSPEPEKVRLGNKKNVTFNDEKNQEKVYELTSKEPNVNAFKYQQEVRKIQNALRKGVMKMDRDVYLSFVNTIDELSPYIKEEGLLHTLHLKLPKPANNSSEEFVPEVLRTIGELDAKINELTAEFDMDNSAESNPDNTAENGHDNHEEARDGNNKRSWFSRFPFMEKIGRWLSSAKNFIFKYITYVRGADIKLDINNSSTNPDNLSSEELKTVDSSKKIDTIPPANGLGDEGIDSEVAEKAKESLGP